MRGSAGSQELFGGMSCEADDGSASFPILPALRKNAGRRKVGLPCAKPETNGERLKNAERDAGRIAQPVCAPENS